ncbi:MAG: rubredoxin [Methanobacteriaceae archaeon]
MTDYKCSVCGYIYSPAVGDVRSGIEAGTDFEDIPESWVCPHCGAGKIRFRQMN